MRVISDTQPSQANGFLAYWRLTGMPTLRLTKQSIATLSVPPGKADALFFDTELAGFGVKASAGGSRRFIVQYRPTGQRTAKRLSIGTVGLLSLEEARRQARILLAKALTGEDPHSAKAAEKSKAEINLGGVADIYLADCEKRLRPNSIYQNKLHLTKHWEPLRSRPLHKIRRADVAARLTELRDSSGGVSANRSRAALSALFAWAIGQGIAETNPVTGTPKPKEERPRERVLTNAELVAVWRACRNDAHGRIVRLLMLTAQRRDEVGSMTASELDLAEALWTLPAPRSKNHREHAVPLSIAAVEILQGAPRLADRDTIFGEGVGGFSGWSQSKKRLDGRLKAAGTPVASWTLHDLRRTAATGMANLGVLPHVVEAVLNHVSGSRAGVAGIYNRASYASEKRAALDHWARHVEALLNGP